MADMLVKLYNVTPDHALIARLEQQQIAIKRVLAPDTGRVIRFTTRMRIPTGLRSREKAGWGNARRPWRTIPLPALLLCCSARSLVLPDTMPRRRGISVRPVSCASFRGTGSARHCCSPPCLQCGMKAMATPSLAGRRAAPWDSMKRQCRHRLLKTHHRASTAA